MQAQADWVLEPTGEREMDPLENVWEGYEPGVRPRRYHGGECPGKSGSFPGQGLRNR